MFKTITDASQLDVLFENSSGKPVVIFKHSNSCPISQDVRDSLNSFSDEIFEIVVQVNRDLSNSVAERTGIRHESPQALVIFNGKAIYNASHYDITGDEISKAIHAQGE